MRKLVLVRDNYYKPNLAAAISIAKEKSRTGAGTVLFVEGLVRQEGPRTRPFRVVPTEDPELKKLTGRLGLEYHLAMLNALVWAGAQNDAGPDFIVKADAEARGLGLGNAFDLATRGIARAMPDDMRRKVDRIVTSIGRNGQAGITGPMLALFAMLEQSALKRESIARVLIEADIFFSKKYGLRVPSHIPGGPIEIHLEPVNGENPVEFARRFGIPLNTLRIVREIHMAYCIAKADFEVGVAQIGTGKNDGKVLAKILQETNGIEIEK